jgi:flagellar motor switch protein FliN/FliY
MATAQATQRPERERHNLAYLGNVAVEGVAELARTTMKLAEVRRLRKGDIIELDKLAGEAFTLRLNDRPFAEGEIVVVADAMGLRLTRMIEYPTEEAAP